MEKLCFVFLVAVALVGCKAHEAILKPHLAPPLVSTTDSITYSPRLLIVMFDSAIGKLPLLKRARLMRCEVVYEYDVLNGVALKVPDDMPIEKAMEKLRKVKGVLSVERDRVLHLDENGPESVFQDQAK